MHAIRVGCARSAALDPGPGAAELPGSAGFLLGQDAQGKLLTARVSALVPFPSRHLILFLPFPCCLSKYDQVRHAAVETIILLFQHGTTLLSVLRQHAEQVLDKVVVVQAKASATVLHALGLWRQILPYMSVSYIDAALDTCARLLKQRAPYVPELVYALVLDLVRHERAADLPAKTLAHALDLLLLHQPARTDVAQRHAWNQVVSATTVQLAERQPELIHDVLPQFVTSCFECYLGHKVGWEAGFREANEVCYRFNCFFSLLICCAALQDDLAMAATQSLQQALQAAVPPIVASFLQLSSGTAQVKSEPEQALQELATAVSAGLQYRYQACYPLVMQVRFGIRKGHHPHSKLKNTLLRAPPHCNFLFFLP